MQISKLFFIIITGAALLGGCASSRPAKPAKPAVFKPLGHGNKMTCTGKCDIPFRQADAKCTAQANAAYVPITYNKSGARNISVARIIIKQNCLAGEGYEEVDCIMAEDPDCIRYPRK